MSEIEEALADLAAHTLALKALVATHPDLRKARAYLTVLLTEWEAEHLDESFAQAWPAQETGQRIAQLSAQALRLLAATPPPAPKSPE